MTFIRNPLSPTPSIKFGTTAGEELLPTTLLEQCPVSLSSRGDYLSAWRPW